MCVWFVSSSDTFFVHVWMFPDMSERLLVPSRRQRRGIAVCLAYLLPLPVGFAP
jgi:hypothetical protein